MTARAASIVYADRWAPLPGSVNLATADAIMMEIWIGSPPEDIACRHGMSLRELDDFMERNGRAIGPEAA